MTLRHRSRTTRRSNARRPSTVHDKERTATSSSLGKISKMITSGDLSRVVAGELPLIGARRQKTPTQAVRAFERLAQGGRGGTLPRGKLVRALGLIGYARPSNHHIEWGMREASVSTFHLSAQEFERFVRGYSTVVSRKLMEFFHSAGGESETLPRAQLDMSLLHELSIESLPRLIEEAVCEVAGDAGEDLTLRQASNVAMVLQTRGGLSMKECQEYAEVFKRFDYRDSGLMETKDAGRALRLAGFELSPENVQAVVSELEVDSYFNEVEWFAALRLVYCQQLTHLSIILERVGRRNSSCYRYLKMSARSRLLECTQPTEPAAIISNNVKRRFPADKVIFLLRSMGYAPDPVALQEVADSTKLGSLLNLEDVWRVLSKYRVREGLTNSDLAELDDAFVAFGLHDNSEIEATMFGKLILRLGYRVHPDRLTEYLAASSVCQPVAEEFRNHERGRRGSTASPRGGGNH